MANNPSTLSFKNLLCKGRFIPPASKEYGKDSFCDEFSDPIFTPDFLFEPSSLSDEELLHKANSNIYNGVSSGNDFKILMNGDFASYRKSDFFFLSEADDMNHIKAIYKNSHTEEQEALLRDTYHGDLDAYAKALYQEGLLENPDYFNCIIQMVYELCDTLAFWSGGDIEQMNRIFCQSKLHDRLNGAWETVYKPFSVKLGELVLHRARKHMKSSYHKSVTRGETIRDQNAIFVEAGGTAVTLADYQPENEDKYRWNDNGIAKLVAEIYQDTLVYCDDRKSWFVYDGRKWVADNLRAKRICDDFVDALMDYSECFPNLAKRIGSRTLYYPEFIRRYDKRRNRENILKDAMAYNAVSSTVFDNADKKYLFNCLNGTYDLQHGIFYAHQAFDMLTMISGVWYDETAHCDRWEQHIFEVFNGPLTGTDKKKKELLQNQTEEQKELPRFLQQVLAYSLTGNTSLSCGYILYGPTGRNGKSLTLDTILRMMGDYGNTTSPSTITQARTTNASGPTENIARLCGKRFVSIAEPEIGMVLSEALVKNLTGNDKIVARNLREGSIEFYPQFKIFINTNHKPEARDTTVFNRLVMIPFDYRFTGTQQDTTLQELFSRRESLSGIFNWCLKGLPSLEVLENEEKTWQIERPESLEERNKDFKNEVNTIELFINEDKVVHKTKNPDDAIPRRELFDRYIKWCKATNNIGYGRQLFNQIMESIPGIKYSRTRPKDTDGEQSEKDKKSDNARHCFTGIKWTDEERALQDGKLSEEEKAKRAEEAKQIKQGITVLKYFAEIVDLSKSKEVPVPDSSPEPGNSDESEVSPDNKSQGDNPGTSVTDGNLDKDPEKETTDDPGTPPETQEPGTEDNTQDKEQLNIKP